jgi:hypothetical protein
MHDDPRRLFRPVCAFDEESAHALLAAVAELEQDAAVEIDLSGAWDIQDHELAILAAGLAGCGRAVALRGISLHHARVLRYLGLDLGAAPTPGASGTLQLSR